MSSESAPKSSITVDTAFRKDLSLQGCTTLPTRANRLLTPHVTSSLGGRQRVEGYTLFMRKSIHDPQVTPPKACSHSRTPGRCHMPTTHTHIIKTSSTYSHQDFRTTGPWIDVHTLVVDRGSHSPHAWLYARLGSDRSENVRSRSADRTSNHIPMWSSIQAFNHTLPLHTIN